MTEQKGIPFDPEFNVGDQFVALGAKIEIAKVDGVNLLCKNLEHNGRLFTIPKQEFRLILAEAKFREQLTKIPIEGSAPTPEAEYMVDDLGSVQLADPTESEGKAFRELKKKIRKFMPRERAIRIPVGIRHRLHEDPKPFCYNL